MPRWTTANKKGYISSHGYRRITVDGKQIYEHRYIMEKSLGRSLEKSEQIDHLNGIKTDNRIENLRLIDITNHLRDEHKRGVYQDHLTNLHGGIIDKTPKLCQQCKKPFFKMKRWRTRKFCSATCRNQWMRNELWKLTPQYLKTH